MLEEEIIQFVRGLPGIEAITGGADALEVARGDTFFFYDPDGDIPADRRLPFATIVTKDYEGFDTASNLDRPGVFRVNIAVGRSVYQDLFGHPPAAYDDHRADYAYDAVDQLLPHPVYAVQGWVSVLNPGEATAVQTRSLLVEAHVRAAERHQRRR